jgi:hypothetical protein
MECKYCEFQTKNVMEAATHVLDKHPETMSGMEKKATGILSRFTKKSKENKNLVDGLTGESA